MVDANPSAGALYTLDITDGTATRIGTADKFGLSSESIVDANGIAALNGALYMVYYKGLTTLNATTGVATSACPANNNTCNGGAQSFDGLTAVGSTLYMVGATTLGGSNTHVGRLYKFNDLSTGIPTQVGGDNFGLGRGVYPGAIATLNNTLYMVTSTAIGTPALYTVDTSTGNATQVGGAEKFGAGLQNADGLVAVDGVLYMVTKDTDALYKIIISEE